MTTMTGTLINGSVKLDDVVNLPNNSRVTVSIQPIDHDPSKSLVAWERLQKRLRDQPINSGGAKFTRDELHDRD